jgi:ribosomal protein S18 acetylase RimI-like enzyme
MISPEENVAVLIEAWKLMVGRLPHPDIRHTDGVATMFAHVPLPFLNLSIPDHPLPDANALRETLGVMKQRANSCRHASLLGLCTDWAPDDWAQVAAEERLAVAVNVTGMEADRLLPPRRPLPGLELRRVADPSSARDIAMVNAHAYAMAPEMFEYICNLHLWHEDSLGYVGYVAGRPMTSAAAFPVAGTMYIAFVATVPEAHGQGCAEAVMRHVIEQGAEQMGPKRMTLHASDAGLPLYRSMGFEAGSRVALLTATDGSAHS